MSERSEPAGGRRRRAEAGDDPSAGRPEDVLLTTAQVAQLLHLTPKRVVQLIQSRVLKAHRLPGTRQYLFWRQDVYDLIDAHVVRPEDAAAEEEGEAEEPAALSDAARSPRRRGPAPARARRR